MNRVRTFPRITDAMSGWWRRQYEIFLSAPPQQDLVFDMIAKASGGLTAGDIERKIDLSPSSVAHILRHLEAAGRIEDGGIVKRPGRKHARVWVRA